MIVVVAPRPDENAMPCSAPSRLASASSSAPAGRVGGARVVVALVLADLLLHVGRGLVDRRDHGAGGRVRVLARVDGSASRIPSAQPSRVRARRSGRGSIRSRKPGCSSHGKWPQRGMRPTLAPGTSLAVSTAPRIGSGSLIPCAKSTGSRTRRSPFFSVPASKCCLDRLERLPGALGASGARQRTAAALAGSEK